MDLNYLLNILLRRKWLLLSVIFLSASTAWYFIGKLPPTYKAESIISTGIIDYKGVSLQRENPFIQKFQIESSFNGLIGKMKSKVTVKTLTEKLLAHDLLADGLLEKPFRTPDPEELKLTQGEIEDIALKLKTNNSDSILNTKPVEQKPDIRLAEAYGYDYESLMKKLEVKRIAETDNLKVEFESESPELSYFVVNTFIVEFFKQHEDDLSYEENEALRFNKDKLWERKADLDSVIVEINLYKSNNGLLDVSTQRETVIGQKKELELRLEETNQSIPSLNRQIKKLGKQIFEYNKISGNAAYKEIQFNDDIIEINNKIDKLNNRIIERVVAGFKNNSSLESQLEILKNRRVKLMDQSFAIIPSSEKDRIDDELKDLVTRKLDKELELELANEAQSSYRQEINRLQGRANKLVVDDGHLYYLTEEKNRLDTEYKQVRKEYEDSKLHADGTESPLKVFEPVDLPEKPEPKNRALFSVFAGVAGGSLSSIFLLLLAFVDSSISSPNHFNRITRLPLLGHVNKIKVKNLNLQQLFSSTQKKNELEFFKENIRKIRTAFENSSAKSFLFVSPKEQEGKSFLIVLLAYALSLNNKKILIIDTNFKNNTLSAFKTKSNIEITTAGSKVPGISTGRQALPPPPGQGDPYMKNIDIVGNKGGSQSPSEVLAGKDFKKIMDSYRKKYDFIFLEAAAMNKFSDARELLPYVDKLAVIFSSESPVGNQDKDTLEYLKGMNGKMFGGILNNVDLKNI